jgi:ankyrin repeat protein
MSSTKTKEPRLTWKQVQALARDEDRTALQEYARKWPERAGSSLLDAVGANDAATLTALLKSGADPEWAMEEDGRTLLHYAATFGTREMVGALLDAGLEIDPVDDVDVTPLIAAASEGRTDIVQLLVERGAYLGEGDWWPALDAAAEEGQEETFAYLLTCCPVDKDQLREYRKEIQEAQRVRERNRPPSTDKKTKKLLEAVLFGQKNKTEEMLAAGADPNGIGDDGSPALNTASIFGKTPLVRMLLDAGADPNTTDYKGMTALHCAACVGSVEVAELLVGAGADLNAVDDEGRTPLAIAADYGKSELTKWLLDAGARTDDRSPEEVLAQAEERERAEIEGLQSLVNAMSEFAERLGDQDRADRLKAAAKVLDDPTPEAVAALDMPLEVELRPVTSIRWKGATAKAALQAFDKAGFARGGAFVVDGMGLRLQSLVAKSDRLYAVVYESKAAGVWVDVLAPYEDGSLTVSNAPAGGEVSQRPEHPKVFLPGASPTELLERIQVELAGRTPAPVSVQAFPEYFEQSYREEMRWRLKLS